MWGKKKIAIVFVILVFVCVLAAVLVLVLNRNNFFGQGEAGGTFPESMHTKELEEVNELAQNMTTEEAKMLYEGVIAEADTEEKKAEARIEYGRYLLDDGELELFVEQFEQVDEELLGPGYDILYYAALREYYALEGEDEISEEYNEKVRIVVENSDYAAGG